jgi:hypothetical protein
MRCALRFAPIDDPGMQVTAKLLVPRSLTYATIPPQAPSTVAAGSTPNQKKRRPHRAEHQHASTAAVRGSSLSFVPVDETPRSSASEPLGGITIRYQPNPNLPYTFFDVKARAGAFGGGSATLRACYFEPSVNTAVFASLPLLAQQHAAPPGAWKSNRSRTTPREYSPLVEHLRLGVKYTSPHVSVGGIIAPVDGTLHQAWLCGRAGGFLWGLQTEPNLPLGEAVASFLPKKLSSYNFPSSSSSAPFSQTAPPRSRGRNDSGSLIGMDAVRRPATSFAVAYQTGIASGKGAFTAAMEVRPGGEMAVSFLHHMAMQRNVRNPLEARDVVGITNYVDVGFELVSRGGAGQGRPVSSGSLQRLKQPTEGTTPTTRVGEEVGSKAALGRVGAGAPSLASDEESFTQVEGSSDGARSVEHIGPSRSRFMRGNEASSSSSSSSSSSPFGKEGGEQQDISNIVRLAAAWQINKNVMVKGRVGLDGAAASAVFKGWWQPALTLGVAASKSWSGGATRVGMTMSVETYSNLRRVFILFFFLTYKLNDKSRMGPVLDLK